jgi:DNA-binding MurR/RpiR family transcriptional regulator
MDPSRKFGTLRALKDEMEHMSPQMRTAGKYILDYPGEFGLDPIRVTARKSGVSTYTLVNIAKKLGFRSFEELREPFRQALVDSPESSEGPLWMNENHAEGSSEAIYIGASKNSMAIVKKTLERQKLTELDEIANLLLSARTVYLTAVRSSYAMAYYFHYVGRMALPSLQLIPRHMNSAIDDLTEAGPGDVMIAITITPYSRETIKACEIAQDKGVKLLIISDSEVVSPNLKPAANLVASVVSTHHFGCFSGILALIESLIALLVHKGQAPARERINAYEQLRKENNAYWVAQKKH